MPPSLKTSLLLLIVMLAGCAAPRLPAPVIQPPPPPVCPPPPLASPDSVALKALLNYQFELRTLSPADLTHELAALSEQTSRGPDLAMRKALVLSLGHTSAELTLAQAQLDAVTGSIDPQAEALKPLISLLATRIAEQRRLLDANDRLNLQLRESQRRSDQLTEKLEALKAIEHTLPASSLPPATAASTNGR